jgi:hypothetical protein
MVFAPAMGLSTNTPIPGPRAVVSESVFEFQPVIEGSQIVHDFIIENRGDSPLAIPHLKSG